MKKEFLKMAGVEKESDFYKLFPTEEAFFGMYPEAKKLVQKKYGGLVKAQDGLNQVQQTPLVDLSESHKQIIGDTKKQMINWYAQRVNNPDPRISAEAKDVLSKLNLLPNITNKNVEYVPFTKLVPSGAVAQFNPDPINPTITATDPYTNFEEQVQRTNSSFFGPFVKNNMEYLNQPKKRRKELKQGLQDFYNKSIQKYPFEHEVQHFYADPAMDFVDKQKKDILSKYIPIRKYIETVFDRDAPESLKEKKMARKRMDYKANLADVYLNATGWKAGARQKGQSRDPINRMRNEEMYRTLMDIRTTFGVDPTTNKNTQQFKDIYQKISNLYNSALEQNNESDAMKYRHMIDFFDILGNDFEKVNQINNILVKSNAVPNEENYMQKAEEGLNVTTDPPGSSFQDKAANFYEKYFGMPKANSMLGTLANHPLLHPVRTAAAQQKNPAPLAVQILDPTGVSNWGNVKTAYEDVSNAKGFWPTLGYGALAGLETLGSIPVIGKVPKGAAALTKGIKGAKGVKAASKVTKPSLVKRVLNVKPIANIDRITRADRLLPSPANPALRKVTNFTNSMNRGTRFMKGLFGGLEYGFDKLTSGEPAQVPGVGPVTPGYTIDKGGKPMRVEDDSLYVNPSGGDQIITIKTPDGKVVKMSTGSKAYGDFIDRVDESSTSYDDKTGMYISTKYKK